MIQRNRRLLVALLLLACPVISQGANEVVSDCSSDAQLRAKLSSIQFSGGGTLTFACGAPREIALTGGVLPSIFTNTTIDGGGTITLNGLNATRILEVSFLGGLTLQRIKLTNGSSAEDGGAISNAGGLALTDVEILNSTALTARGGAISVTFFGVLTITDSRLANNIALSGGAIFADSVTALTAVTITNSVLHDNHATGGDSNSGFGGAILLFGADASIEGGELYNNDARTGGAIMSLPAESELVVHGTVILDNRARNGSGGGIRLGLDGSGSSGVLTDVTLYGNKAEGGVLDFPTGGGLYCDKCSLDLQRSTLAANSATNRGGGLYLTGPVPSSQLVNVTLAGNTGGTFGGGGMYVNSGVINLTNVSVVSNNAAAGTGGGIASLNSSIGLRNVLLANANDNCHFVSPVGTPVKDSNLSSDATCSFGPSRDNVNPTPSGVVLKENGGPTQTVLFEDGPTIDGGTLNGCPPIDQRGAPRPAGASCDVGAVESDSVVPTTTTTITTTTIRRATTTTTTTTTTLPSALCGPACVTTDPCRPQACVQTGCVAQDLAGLASASCACQRTPPAACANQVPPRKVLGATTKACNLLNAATAGPTGRRRVKKLTKAGQQFRTARRLVSKRPAKRVLTPDCASALGADYDDAASRVGAVLRSGGG